MHGSCGRRMGRVGSGSSQPSDIMQILLVLCTSTATTYNTKTLTKMLNTFTYTYACIRASALIPMLLAMAPTTLAQSTIYYSYGFTSSSSCTGPPASITKYIVVNTSTTRSSTGDTAPYLLNAGVYPDDPCGLLADHSFSKARVLAETQDCCFHYMFTKGVGGMYHSAVNTRNREKGFDKGLDEVYCETMGDAGASLFVRRNECVPFTYGDGSLYCNGTSLVLFSRFQCMGASETFGWKEGGMVDSKILGRFQMGSSGWTSGIVEKSRLINPG